VSGARNRAHALTRRAVRQALLECSKLPILALTKCDLVPTESLKSTLEVLRTQLPALPLGAPSDAEAGKDAGADEGLRAIEKVLACARRDRQSTAESADKSVEIIRVGIVGFDGVGKRTLLRRLRSHLSHNNKGSAKGRSGSKGVELLSLPARLEVSGAVGVGLNDVLLRGCNVAQAARPDELVSDLISRADRRSLLQALKIGAFGEISPRYSRDATEISPGSSAPRPPTGPLPAPRQHCGFHSRRVRRRRRRRPRADGHTLGGARAAASVGAWGGPLPLHARWCRRTARRQGDSPRSFAERSARDLGHISAVRRRRARRS